MPNGNFFDLLEWMSGFNWSRIPGRTLAQRGQYILETIQMVGRFDPNNITRVRYPAPPGIQFPGIDHELYPDIIETLGRAIRTLNPVFIKQILGALIPLVQNQSAFHSSLRNLFVSVVREAIRRPNWPWNQVATLLLEYYNAKEDPTLWAWTYANAFQTGDFDLVWALAGFTPDDVLLESFWDATKRNEMPLVTRFHDLLLAREIDPIREINPNTGESALQGVYDDAISEGDLAYIMRLAPYGPPTQENLDWALEQNQPEIAAFIQSQLQ